MKGERQAKITGKKEVKKSMYSRGGRQAKNMCNHGGAITKRLGGTRVEKGRCLFGLVFVLRTNKEGGETDIEQRDDGRKHKEKDQHIFRQGGEENDEPNPYNLGAIHES